jgi:hypothetical protein
MLLEQTARYVAHHFDDADQEREVIAIESAMKPKGKDESRQAFQRQAFRNNDCESAAVSRSAGEKRRRARPRCHVAGWVIAEAARRGYGLGHG